MLLHHIRHASTVDLHCRGRKASVTLSRRTLPNAEAGRDAACLSPSQVAHNRRGLCKCMFKGPLLQRLSAGSAPFGLLLVS